MDNPNLNQNDLLTLPINLGKIGAARMEYTIPSGYRLVNRNGNISLQGYFRWEQGSLGGGDWKDIPTVIEGSD